jgi:hypothetical protein
VCAYNFSPKGHIPRKIGDYREHATHYLMVGSVYADKELVSAIDFIARYELHGKIHDLSDEENAPGRRSRQRAGVV